MNGVDRTVPASLPKCTRDERRDDLVAQYHRAIDKTEATKALIEAWLTDSIDLWKDLRLAKSLVADLPSSDSKKVKLLEKIAEEEEFQLMRRC